MKKYTMYEISNSLSNCSYAFNPMVCVYPVCDNDECLYGKYKMGEIDSVSKTDYLCKGYGRNEFNNTTSN